MENRGEGAEGGLPETAALPGLRTELGACAALSIVINLLMLTGSVYMINMYDRVLPTGSLDTLWSLTAIAVGLLVVFGILTCLRGRILARTALHLEREVAPLLARRILDSAFQRGGAPAATMDDLATVRGFFAGPAVTAFFDAPMMPVFLILIFLLHPLLGAVATVAALILAALAVANDRFTRQPMTAANAAAAEARRQVLRTRRRAESVDALGMADRLLLRWRGAFHRSQVNQLCASERSGAAVALSRAVRLTAQVALYGTGAWLVLHHEVTAGVLFGASLVMARALSPVEQAIAGWRQATGAHDAYRRVRETLARAPRRGDAMELPAPEGRLEVEGVSYTPPGADRPVLTDVSFAIAPGEVLAVIGPSGSGKSTLARLLVGIEAPGDGHVRLDGADIFARPREQVGRYLGYLPQSVDLVGDTVADAIGRLGATNGEAGGEAVVDAAERAGAHEMVLRLPGGYDAPLFDEGRNLSGGQRQLIGLARAVFGRPRLVVLDEPNSSLDNQGEAALARAVQNLKAEGASVVIIGHRTSTLADADRILVLNGGKVAAFGARDAVIGMIGIGGPAARPRKALPASGAPARLVHPSGAAPAAAGDAG